MPEDPLSQQNDLTTPHAALDPYTPRLYVIAIYLKSLDGAFFHINMPFLTYCGTVYVVRRLFNNSNSMKWRSCSVKCCNIHFPQYKVQVTFSKTKSLHPQSIINSLIHSYLPTPNPNQNHQPCISPPPQQSPSPTSSALP